MSGYAKTPEIKKLEYVGRLLASRLHEARQRCGLLLCPVCHTIFEGTHVIKCPFCRTLISKSFQEVQPPSPSGKMELDFFPAPLNRGEECAENNESVPVQPELT